MKKLIAHHYYPPRSVRDEKCACLLGAPAAHRNSSRSTPHSYINLSEFNKGGNAFSLTTWNHKRPR